MDDLMKGLAAISLILLFLGFRAWLAGGDTRCFFAQDPATCATVLNK